MVINIVFSLTFIQQYFNHIQGAYQFFKIHLRPFLRPFKDVLKPHFLEFKTYMHNKIDNEQVLGNGAPAATQEIR